MEKKEIMLGMVKSLLTECGISEKNYSFSNIEMLGGNKCLKFWITFKFARKDKVWNFKDKAIEKFNIAFGSWIEWKNCAIISINSERLAEVGINI